MGLFSEGFRISVTAPLFRVRVRLTAFECTGLSRDDTRCRERFRSVAFNRRFLRRARRRQLAESNIQHLRYRLPLHDHRAYVFSNRLQGAGSF